MRDARLDDMVLPSFLCAWYARSKSEERGADRLGWIVRKEGVRACVPVQYSAATFESSTTGDCSDEKGGILRSPGL